MPLVLLSLHLVEEAARFRMTTRLTKMVLNLVSFIVFSGGVCWARVLFLEL